MAAETLYQAYSAKMPQRWLYKKGRKCGVFIQLQTWLSANTGSGLGIYPEAVPVSAVWPWFILVHRRIPVHIDCAAVYAPEAP